MKQRFLPVLVIVLAISAFFSSASFAADPSTAASKKAVTAPASGKMVAKEVSKPGGWSRFEMLTPSDRAVFKETMGNLTWVGYRPVAVRKQVVAGMNYEFFCNARVVYPGKEWYPVMVLIYKPLNGNAVIKKISKVETH